MKENKALEGMSSRSHTENATQFVFGQLTALEAGIRQLTGGIVNGYVMHIIVLATFKDAMQCSVWSALVFDSRSYVGCVHAAKSGSTFAQD